jgi:hypothetical protein
MLKRFVAKQHCAALFELTARYAADASTAKLMSFAEVFSS